MLKSLWLILFGVLTYNFSFAQEGPDVLESGITTDSTYFNASFNFQINVPKGWVINKTDQVAAAVEKGSDMMAGDNESLKAAIKSSVKRSGYLLMASEFPMGAPVPMNPTIAIVSEDVSLLPGIVTGADYLYHVKQLMSQSQVKIETKQINKIKIGPTDFGSMETSLVGPQGTHVKQVYYSTISNRYAISFLIMYSTDQQSEVLQKTIDSYKALNR